MNKVIFTILILSLCSCTSSNKYEKLISDYAQTDKQGTWTDIQFKALEIKELEPIKVSDSITILKEEFDNNKSEQLQKLESYLKKNKEGLEKEQNSRFKMPTIVNMYTKYIENTQLAIDSIGKQEFVNIYGNVSADKILLQPVECRYSYVFPPTNPLQERSEVFYFLPDASKIVKSKQIKK
ncbi:hypothetical protein [Dysgonomonas sp. ZJ709]|uniref:hypothetical protein n=1 Tax=Dysgonomonas sp. ZJ709 TaxID=2709797 RepID=UPI0013EAFCA2|nr:hypothetical protein [Dysgonomonas sp. ZJ709]